MHSAHPDLTEEDLRALRQRLEAELAALHRRAATLVEDDGRGDSADRATLEDTHQTLDRLRDVDQQRARMIREALVRMDEGSYGICVETSEPIGKRRLFAIPEVALSVEAAEALELEQGGPKPRRGLLDEFDPL